MRRHVVFLVMAACGGGSSPTVDAGPDAAHDPDAMPDPLIDAMPEMMIDAMVEPPPPCEGTPLVDLVPMLVTPTRSTSAVVADFDGDGIGDFATGGTTITIARGLGDGRFATPVVVTIAARALAVADIDGDGDRDLVAVADGLYVLANSGNGTFAPQAFALPANVALLALGDLDGDGDVDAATVHHSVGFVFDLAIMKNTGTGAFGAAATSMLTVIDPTSLALVDVDHNGSPDIVMSSGEEKAIAVMRNIGDGTFYGAQRSDLGMKLHAVAIADLDGDNKRDAVVSGTTGLRFVQGNGDGTFSTATLIVGPTSRRLELVDMTNDGVLDLVTLGQIAVMTGAGNGTFSAPRLVDGNYEDRPVLGQINADGRPDLVIPAWNGVEVLLNDGSGGFRTWTKLRVAVAPSPTLATISGFASGDFDGDGDGDLAALSGQSELRVFWGSGAGFVSGPVVPGTPANSIAVADFDGNGRDDIISASSLYLAPAFAPSPLGTNVGYPYVTFAPDLDHDGDPDLLYLSAFSNLTSLLRNAAGFSGPISTQINEIVHIRAVIDVNGDTFPDVLATPSTGSGSARLWIGNGDGSFDPPIDTTGFAAGDVNGDGIADLAGATGLALGTGSGAFQPVLPYTLDVYPAHLRIVDFDGDGKQDVLALDIYGTLSILGGNGDGTFAPRVVYGTGGQKTDLALIDFDRDGRLDIVFEGYGADLTLVRQRACPP